MSYGAVFAPSVATLRCPAGGVAVIDPRRPVVCGADGRLKYRGPPVYALGTAFGQVDVADSCPWPWEDLSCPPDCYCTFAGVRYATDEVYVLRVKVDLPSPIDSTSKALLFARALGQSFVSMEQTREVRGVAVKDLSGGLWQVDIVYTSPEGGTPFVSRTVEGMREDIDGNKTLRDAFPGMSVLSAKRLELIAPSSVIYWLSVPVVWSSQLELEGGAGGPTRAYGSGQNVWRGTAAERQVQMAPKKPAPGGPGPGGGPGARAGPSTVAVGVVLLGGFWLWRRKKKGKRFFARR